MTDKEKMEMVELIQAIQSKTNPKRDRKTKKGRYMKRVVNIIFVTALVLTVIYLYMFWKFQLEPVTLIVSTFAFLGVEAVALAKIRWEEEKGVKYEQDKSEREF